MLLYTIVTMINYLISVVSWVVIIQFIIGMLIAFNVINTRNDAVMQIYRGLSVFLEPLLGPIRRAMPNTGAVDFSPMVLIVGLRLVSMLLTGVAMQGY